MPDVNMSLVSHRSSGRRSCSWSLWSGTRMAGMEARAALFHGRRRRRHKREAAATRQSGGERAGWGSRPTSRFCRRHSAHGAGAWIWLSTGTGAGRESWARLWQAMVGGRCAVSGRASEPLGRPLPAACDGQCAHASKACLINSPSGPPAPFLSSSIQRTTRGPTCRIAYPPRQPSPSPGGKILADPARRHVVQGPAGAAQRGREEY